EERRLDQLAVEEMRQRVEMADIVAFELELRAAALAKRLKDLLDILEGIPKNEIPGILQMLGFPVVFPLLVAIEHGEEAEIHRPHVERADLRLGAQRRRQPLLEGHAVTAAGGDIDDGVAGLLDARQELHEDFWIGRRLAVPGVARMEMDDRGAGLGGIDRLGGDFVRRQRQIRRHGRGVYRPRHRTGDDDFRANCHERLPPPGRLSRGRSMAPISPVCRDEVTHLRINFAAPAPPVEDAVMADLGLQWRCFLPAGRPVQRSSAAEVCPTAQMSSFSPSTASSAVRSIAAGTTLRPREANFPSAKAWSWNTRWIVCR